MSKSESAFVPGPALVMQGASSGVLAGTTFDVKGYVTGAGNPDWAKTHPAARANAWAVQTLLDTGSTLVGKTVTDEISLGLLGINRFDGTPLNPRAPDRVAGGSSSGSASAVASGLVDLALGTDSGGSVRTPASFTGLYGLRPTHGAIPVDGLMTQSPSFDTVGFFTSKTDLLEDVGSVLLPPADGFEAHKLIIAKDAFAYADPQVQAGLVDAVALLSSHFGNRQELAVATEGIEHWCAAHRALQAFEFGQTFADWIDANNPVFSYEVGRALVLARTLEEVDVIEPRLLREQAKARLAGVLGNDTVLCLPTAPILPISRQASFSQMRIAVDRIIHLTSIAGLTGLPQLNLPIGQFEGIPVGLSLIGPSGSDRLLLALATKITAK